MAGLTLASGATLIFDDATIQTTRPLFRVEKCGITFESFGANPATLHTIPAGSILILAQINVTAGFNGADLTLTVGDAGDADGILTTAVIAPAATGWKVSAIANLGAYLLAAGAWVFKGYTTATAITCTRGGAAGTAGAADIYLVYATMDAY